MLFRVLVHRLLFFHPTYPIAATNRVFHVSTSLEIQDTFTTEVDMTLLRTLLVKGTPSGKHAIIPHGPSAGYATRY